MKRSLILILMLAAVCIAQVKNANKSKPKPDFSGKWQRNASKSHYPRGAPEDTPIYLTISHIEPVLKINHKTVVKGQERIKDLTFYSDKRGETNPGLLVTGFSVGSNRADISKEESQKSTTKWEGDKLVTTSSKTDYFSGFRVDLSFTTERKLSADGKTLTINTIIQTSHGGSTLTEVYDRIP